LGHPVTGLDTDYYFAGDLIKLPEDYSRLHTNLGDVTREELEGFGAIIHLPALSKDPLGDLNSEWTYDINYNAFLRLGALAKKARVRWFLYASSGGLCGARGEETLNEDAPMRPLTPYGESKLPTEEARSRLEDSQFAPTLLRKATANRVSPPLCPEIVLNNLVA
jgi:nucleoside-diphosphate-sugar epimerase